MGVTTFEQILEHERTKAALPRPALDAELSKSLRSFEEAVLVASVKADLAREVAAPLRRVTF